MPNTSLQNIYVETLLEDGEMFGTQLSYQVFGQPLGSAPLVLVNHALTGNSNVTGEHGWWNNLIGDHKTINTQHYTILAFNIPGNGYDGHLIDDYKAFSIKVVAHLFLKGLQKLNIQKVYAIIGSSLGGAIAWQMVYEQSAIFEHIIPIATDYTMTDWLKAQCHIQDIILNQTNKPLQNARQQAMLTYRTPTSINQKFNNNEARAKNRHVKEWLTYHGDALDKRYELKAYKLMNHLLSTIDVTNDKKKLKAIKSTIHLVAIDSDLLFLASRNKDLYNTLKEEKENIFYDEIKSIHGHDAFLIEFEQLNKILNPLFKS